jgi:AcrR family transcriptional regulator
MAQRKQLKPKVEPQRRTNMRAADRERFILEGAVRFFAEHGFAGQTRELAKSLSMSHAAIYRHFPSKDALIERVYEHVYLSRWNPDWGALIVDRSRLLEARLIQFYLEYAERIFTYEWVRIFVYSGLRSFDLSARYLQVVQERLITPICIEFRAECGLPGIEDAPLSERERELFWGLHGRIFYLAIRKFVYGVQVPEDLGEIIRDAVHATFVGMKPGVEHLIEIGVAERIE